MKNDKRFTELIWAGKYDRLGQSAKASAKQQDMVQARRLREATAR